MISSDSVGQYSICLCFFQVLLYLCGQRHEDGHGLHSLGFFFHLFCTIASCSWGLPVFHTRKLSHKIVRSLWQVPSWTELDQVKSPLATKSKVIFWTFMSVTCLSWTPTQDFLFVNYKKLFDCTTGSLHISNTLVFTCDIPKNLMLNQERVRFVAVPAHTPLEPSANNWQCWSEMFQKSLPPSCNMENMFSISILYLHTVMIRPCSSTKTPQHMKYVFKKIICN